MLGIAWIQNMSSLLHLTFFYLTLGCHRESACFWVYPVQYCFIISFVIALLNCLPLVLLLSQSHLCSLFMQWVNSKTLEWSESRSVMSDSLGPHGLYSPWHSPGQNTGVGSLSLLQGIFSIQGLNPGLLHCRQILYQLRHKWSPRILEWVACPFSRGTSQGSSLEPGGSQELGCALGSNWHHCSTQAPSSMLARATCSWLIHAMRGGVTL